MFHSGFLDIPSRPCSWYKIPHGTPTINKNIMSPQLYLSFQSYPHIYVINRFSSICKKTFSIGTDSLLYILNISDLCLDENSSTAKACKGLHEDGNCAPATGYCGCDTGYKLNIENNACVKGSYLIHII